MINKNIVILILAIGIIVAGSYIGYSKFIELGVNKQNEAYTIGLRQGYEQAIVQVAQEVAKCQQVPLTIQNQTINIIAVECLQQ